MIIFNHCISIITVVVKKPPHGAVLVIRLVRLHDFYNTSIQSACILSCSVVPCNKSNMASVRSIAVHNVTNEFVWKHHHSNVMTNASSVIMMIEHQQVPTAKRLQIAATPIVAEKNSDKNNPFHYCAAFLYSLMCGEFLGFLT